GGHAKQSITLYDKGDYAGSLRAADEGLTAYPGDSALWGMRVRAALALGDGAGVAKAYGDYVAKRGGDDRELLRDLAEATLWQALAAPSAKLKMRAIQAVEDLEISSLADDVAKQLGDDDDRVQATAAIAVLHGYKEALQVADQMLRSENAEARRIALEGVAKKIGKLAIADIENAANDNDARVRAIAVRWLGQYKDKDAVEVCTKRLHDHDEGVRAAAVIALVQIGLGDTGAAAKTALADHQVTVRLAGVRALAMLEDEDKLVALAADPDRLVALAAAIEIKTKHPDLVQTAVQRALLADDWAIRAGAVNQLAQALGKDAAIAAAKPLLADPELAVRLAAARVLVHAGDRVDAMPVLEAALAAHDLDATADLAALDDPRGLQALAELASDPKRTPEQRAAAAAAHRTAHHVTPALVAALADASGLVRVEAAATLGALAKN
ncbi:MAG TPA: HEAT repeat domain-containing protein, partial [Kofleriaceae bacterium]|nr:HEAT repeat domain-containing protein [Kofleriaceae bacterium]